MNLSKNGQYNDSKHDTDKIAATAGTFGSEMNHKVEDLYASAKETLGTAGTKIGDSYVTARDSIKKAGSQLESVVKANPFSSIAAAIGLGWIAGKMFSGKSDRT